MAEEAEMQKKLHDSQAIEPGRDIVNHNPDSLRQSFKLPHRIWFYDIEGSKKYKARQKRFPSKRGTKERDQLPGGLVDNNELRVFDSSSTCHLRGGGNADCYRQYGEEQVCRQNPPGWKKT
jgi:hypothetical protein